MSSQFKRYTLSLIFLVILLPLLVGCGSGGGNGTGGDTGGIAVTGRISLFGGSPLAGATVKLYKTSYTVYSIDSVFYSTKSSTGLESVHLDSEVQSVTTDASGNYKFSGVPSGNYTIQATASGYVFKWSHVPTRSSIGVVSITDNGTVYIYNPEGSGNQLSADGTKIYNTDTPFTITGNTLDGQDFEASQPGGSGI